MGKTDKDAPDVRKERWFASHQPSWFHKALRRRHRTKARQDIRNEREPLPRYRGDREWYW